MAIKLVFYGGVGSTTGANIGLEFKNRKILVDCGILQGSREAEGKNFEPFKYDPSGVEFLLVTHAHMDHIGKIPKLVRAGFKGRIISTIETMEIARPMLEDAFKVMKMKHPNKLLYEMGDIENTFSFWEGRKYLEKINLFENCEVEMHDAGHVLGSAIICVSLNNTKIAFTGDLGNSPSPLLPDTEIPKDINYMVMESVYGDRNHESKIERRQRLKEAILGGIKKGGAIVIPAFSIERTQVLLYEINNMIEDKEVPQIPVFLDSPLAEKVTNIYKKYADNFKESVRDEIKKGDDIFSFPNLKIIGSKLESEEIEKTKGSKIILAGSGMSEGGRVVSHEAHFLPDPNATIILVGYQSVGTLGRHLQDRLKEVYIDTDGNKENGKEKVVVRAAIENITGYSSHKDSEHLIEFVNEVSESKKLKKVFTIMGEPKSSLFLAQRIRDYIGIEAIYPEENKEYELI